MAETLFLVRPFCYPLGETVHRTREFPRNERMETDKLYKKKAAPSSDIRDFQFRFISESARPLSWHMIWRED